MPGSTARRYCRRVPISRSLIATHGEESAVSVWPTRSLHEAIASVTACAAPRKARAVDTADRSTDSLRAAQTAAQPQVETGNARTHNCARIWTRTDAPSVRHLDTPCERLCGCVQAGTTGRRRH